MRKIIMLLVFIITIIKGYAQNTSLIDSSNYYSFLDKRESIIWLEREEVTSVILEELNGNGYFENDTYIIMNLDSAQYVLLSVYNRDLKIGFLYPQIHEYPPKKEHRQMRSSYNKSMGFDYIQRIETLTSRPIVVKIKQLPENIIILNEDCYWYQETNSNKKIVTKAIIIKILRQDIRTHLKRIEEKRKK